MKTYKILVLEEETLIAENTRISLEDAGYEVQLAFSVSDALEIASQWKPDLILIGVVSKGGYDEAGAASLIESSISNPLKFIFLVSRPVSVKNRVKNFAILHKPFADEELLKLVEQQLNS